MTDDAIVQWAKDLVDPGLSLSQILQTLLDNSKRDSMSDYDKKICVRALQLIKRGVLYDYPPQPLSCSYPSGLRATDELSGDEQIEEE